MSMRAPYRFERGHTVYGMPLRMAVLLGIAGIATLLGVVSLLNGAFATAVLWILIAAVFLVLAVVRADRLPLERYLIRRYRARRRPRRMVYRLPAERGTSTVGSWQPVVSKVAPQKTPAQAAAAEVKDGATSIYLSPFLVAGALACAAVAFGVLLDGGTIAQAIGGALGTVRGGVGL